LAHAIALVSQGFERLPAGRQGYGMCQKRGVSRSTIFLKMRRVGCINFWSVPSFNFFKVQVVCEVFHLSTWKIFVSRVSTVFFETQICLGPIATNVGVYDGCGFRSASLSHVAERN
jgi:hypothetical protein